MRIYLDFDGCMHCKGRNKFEHIAGIEAILRENPRAHIVISSSWREEHPFDEMRSYFAQDVQRRIVGVTPVIAGARRHEEILRHVEETGYAGAYVAIDDDATEFPASWPALLLCDPDRGFDAEKQRELRTRIEAVEAEAQRAAREPETYAVLQQYSRGEINKRAAMSKLGLRYFGQLLDMLGDADLPLYELPEARAQTMVNDVLQLFSDAPASDAEYVDRERLHSAVLRDLEERTQYVIANPEKQYALGNLEGRLIAFALSKVITDAEYHAFHDRLAAHNLSSRMPQS